MKGHCSTGPENLHVTLLPEGNVRLKAAEPLVETSPGLKPLKAMLSPQ